MSLAFERVDPTSGRGDAFDRDPTAQQTRVANGNIGLGKKLLGTDPETDGR